MVIQQHPPFIADLVIPTDPRIQCDIAIKAHDKPPVCVIAPGGKFQTGYIKSNDRITSILIDVDDSYRSADQQKKEQEHRDH